MPDLGPPLTEAERRHLFSERMKRRNSAYDRKMLDRVRFLIEECGAGYAQVMERVEVSNLDTLRSLCAKYGMKTRAPAVSGGNKNKQYSVDMVNALIDAGCFYEEIARRCGFPSENAARSFIYRHRLGKERLRKFRTVVTQHDIQLVWGLVRDKYSVRKIASMMGRTTGSVTNIIMNYELRKLKECPGYFHRLKDRRYDGRHIPRPCEAVKVAAGSVDTPPRAPEPARYSIRGVSLARV